MANTRIAVFLDTCHSGLAGQGLFTSNDEAVESVLQSVPSGVVVFSAAKGRELSQESAEAGGGFFTRALATVIRDDRDRFDTNGNGALELSELFRGVKGQVLQRVSATAKAKEDGSVVPQTPYMARNRMVGDFALF